MSTSAPIKLLAGETVLQLKAGVTNQKKLPTPVLFVGTATATSSEGISSDAFKRRIWDATGAELLVTDSTLEACYVPLPPEEARLLIDRYWGRSPK